MEASAARADACREYQSSLEDLTFNSKPHINMLTILAEENRTFAKDIVAIIEAQISKAPAAEKLPVLYLVDSIVKNVGGEYLAVFAKNLITSFICVFEKVEENTRKSLFKLRSTWDEVFPLKKLYAVDVRVNAVDPAWPIKPLPPSVNASIHVNPKFLKQSEEASSPQPAPSQPPAPVPAAVVAPAPPPVPAVSQSSVAQEQLIRQQLLAKQKQLLELQQKKIELELEQTKAQLLGGFTLPTAPTASSPAPKTLSPNAPVVRPWVPPQTQSDPKTTTRDPRLNRTGPPAKEQPAGKKGSPALTPEKRQPEKSFRPEKTRTPRKEPSEEKLKSKSLSPMTRTLQSKTKPAEAEGQKASDGSKKDPRLKKRTQDRSGESKEEELKEKKRCNDKKEREEAVLGAELQRFSKGKPANGFVIKHEREDAEKVDLKSGGNARTHARKRTRSRSRSPTSSPKRKDRRSPKGRARSSSLSPPSHKPGKPRRVRAEEPPHGKPPREDRVTLKKSQSESRRSKRPQDERHSESRDSHSPRSHEGSGKETKEAPHRWRSSWQENKHLKLPDDSPMKPGPQRHKPYTPPTRPPTPRTPKHRLSVDANLQIPEALNSASKKDLLRRAGKRLESGEISQEEFLNVAHQIKHFFQYQEEKLQRSESWDGSGTFAKKQPLLAAPASQPRPHDAMDAAELSYYEHKSKLRKTQVTHRVAGEEWEGEENVEDVDATGPGEKTGERRSKEREEARPPLGPMIEEYNHGKEFPTLKSLPGLRFRRRADPRDASEREWNSPLSERQREEQKSGYDAPRRYTPSADCRHPDPRRPEGPLPSGTVVHRKCPSPTGPDPPGPRFERERLSPPHLKEELSPRFESPNSEHSDDGPLPPDAPPTQPPPSLKAPARVGPLASVRQQSSSPGHTPPHEAGHPQSRYNGPEHVAPPRPHPPGWYDDSSQFEGPLPQGGGRFDGGRPHHNVPERFDGPDGAHGPMRGGAGMGRFDVHPHPPGPGRFDGPVGPPARFVGPGPGHFEGPMQHFEPPRHFDSSMAPGPMSFQQQRPMCFEGPPAPMGPMRFEGPGHGYDMPNVPHQGGHTHFEGPPGQQGPPRFPPQHNMQPPMRQMAPPIYDNQMTPQQNFNMGPQCFPAGPMAFPAQTVNFNMQPPFPQPGPAPFYNPSNQQPVNMNQAFLPQSSAPFRPHTPQVIPPENHFGQVDVNELLTKLLSTGIIKPSQPEATPTTSTEPSSVVAPAAPPPEEEEEEEPEEEEDIPDLTSFTVEDMKPRYECVVMRLYSGNQCCLCSMRFTSVQTDLYADHLDWHFRQNHAGKVASKKITHRRWYYNLKDWIEFEEIADLEERAKSHFFEKENEEEVQKNQAAAKEREIQIVRATKDQVGESCEICQEPFETYWVEEEEDWFLKDAVRVDDKNFHPACFEDYKNTSSYLDVTPSPSKLLADHPLGAFLEPKEEEEPSCSIAAASVKQEVEPEAVELLTVKQEEAELLIDQVPSEENIV
ncbi:pre-mRNA cleavage complex 2 protein Pcf11 isoform X2 [Limanda limanda]|uniref:pre-mRNA cleavage complex 2 protein Pcf11 isoform X2 n=1 Tax=Limanda limanda TaxID=27771 RepID=UPI0029C8F65F|nr:pre-mRNA cleavage complex 2 protein Pcf11 isoform X2 [Limanda limanda]